MSLAIFPAHVFNPDPVTADVVQRVISGGTALNDVEDVVATDGGGRWQIAYGDVELDSPYLQRLWAAWTSYLAGGARSLLVPILSLETAPRPIAGNGWATPSDIVANDDYFPTSVGFASPYIVAAVTADAALRATTLQIAVSQGAQIEPGMKFQVGVRAHKVEQVTARSGLAATVKISPPLRDAVSAGAPVNFDWPCVVCRGVVGQDIAASIVLGMFGNTTISFVEDTGYVA